MRKVQIEFCAEVRREPEQIKPPDRIGEELRDRKGPCLAASQQSSPSHGWTPVRGRFLVDMPQFSGCQRGMIGGPTVIEEPPQNPQHAEDTSSEKSRVPSVA